MMQLPISHYEFMARHPLINLKKQTDLIISEFGDRRVSYLEFSKWFMQSFDIDFRATGKGGGYPMAANLLYHCWRMRACGEKIFYLSPNLCRMLNSTRVNVSAADVRPPFEEFYIYTDQEEILIEDSTDGKRPVKGIYVNMCERSDTDKTRVIRVMLTSGADGVTEARDVNYFFRFEMPDALELENCVAAHVHDILEDGGRNSDTGPTNIAATKKSFALICNFILYLSSKNPDVFSFKAEPISQNKKSEHKLRKALKRSLRQCEMPVIVVGSNISNPDPQSSGKTFSISYAFDVRGHWRKQWKGSDNPDYIPELGERRQEIIWVKPFKKGTDFAETINKKYVVKGGSENTKAE